MALFILHALIGSIVYATPNIDFLENAKLKIGYVETAAKHRDVPATCWHLGQVRTDAVYFKKMDKLNGEKFLKLVDEATGRCGGVPDSQDLSVAYSEKDWEHIQKIVEHIKGFKSQTSN